MIRYTAADGLVQRQVMALEIDSDGALWIGTKGGVSRFNGFEFTNFTTREGLLEEQVISLLATPDGSIWVFHNNGISVISEGRIRVIRSPGYVSHAQGAYDNLGQIWVISSVGEEIDLFRIRNDSLFEVPFDSDVLGKIQGFRKDTKTQELYLETSTGYFNLINDRFEPADVVNILPDHAYLGVLRQDGSWFYRDKLNSRILRFRNNDGDESVCSDSSAYISRIITDNHDQVWIGSERGLVKIPTTQIVNYTDPFKVADVWTILEGPGGRIWFGNYAAGLSYLGETGLKKLEESSLGHLELDSRAKTHIYPGGVTGFEGKAFINTSRGVIATDGAVFSSVKGLPSNPVYYSIWDKAKNRLLFSVYRQGIYSWSGRGEAVALTGPLEPRFERIEAMAYDRNNRLWLGSVQGILIMEGDRLLSMEEAGIDFSGGAQCLYRDPDGALWIGNPQGLYVYRGDSVVKMHHPLVNRYIVALAGGPGNRIIAGSADGIGILLPEPAPGNGFMMAEWLDNRNYYLGGEVKNNGIMVDSKERIWIAGSNGVVRIDPAFFNRIRTNVKLKISELLFFDSGEEGNEIRIRPSGDTLPASRFNSVKISWDVVDLTSSHYHTFRFMLGPAYSSWVETRTARSETYFNLRPGDHQFRIETEDCLGNLKTVGISFKVQPKLCQTTGFKAFGIALTVGILILLTWWLTRLSQRRIQLRALRERELNDLRFRAITNQLSPHFTHNVLTAIGSLVLTREPMDAYDHITKFSRMLRSLLGSYDNFLVPLRQELDFVKNYLDLEHLRFPDILNFVFEIAPGVDLETMVPRMILQIPAENAIKHGLSVKPGGGTLRISIRLGDTKELMINILDDGIGRGNGKTNRGESSGRGLSIIKDMLDYQNKIQGTANHLTITDLVAEGLPAGTQVEITLNAIQNTT